MNRKVKEQEFDKGLKTVKDVKRCAVEPRYKKKFHCTCFNNFQRIDVDL